MSAKSFGPPEHDGLLTIVIVNTSNITREAREFVHFLPPGFACTTGLSRNRFTWRPLIDRKNAYAESSAL